jgi:hypothetical protein
MNSFLQYITEIFDKPYPWHWKSQYSRASFTIDSGLKYKVFFSRMYGGRYDDGVPMDEFTFGLDERPDESNPAAIEKLYSITGTGDQFKVFATVIDILKTYLNSQHPTVLYFSAKEPNRKRLYRHFFKMASSILPSKWDTQLWKDRSIEYYLIVEKGFVVSRDSLMTMDIEDATRITL